MKQGFLVAILFLTSIWVSGCSTIQDRFEHGYTSAREHPIRTMSLEELEQARRSMGLKDREYYKEKRIRDAINNR